ncbi:myelin-associated glycoprotein-like, partial [Clarias magur]
SLLVGVCQCWSVSVDSVKAVRGSCVLVPCRTVAFSKVAWYKYVSRGYPTVYSNDRSEILSEFRGRTSVPGSGYSGDCSLRINNVQNSDSEVDLYVWVWDRDGYNQGFYDDHQIIKINVLNPTKPEISVGSYDQVEGKPFTATCKFRHSCRSSSPQIYWHDAPTDVKVDYTGSSSVVEGGQISLTCNSKSRPAPTHHEWLVSPNSVTFSPSRSTVVLQHVTRDTSVSCIATNSVGQGTSKQLWLNILYAPRNVRIDYTRSSPVSEGNKVSLQCTCNSNPAVTAYEWVVTQNTTTTRYRENPLVLQNVRRDTSVSCSVTNSVGTGRSQQLSLSVNYAPTDVTVDYTGSSSVVEGGQISLTCNSASRPAPTHYKWLVSPNSGTFTPHGRTVVLQHVTRETAVSCIATNSIGQGESKQLSLNVLYAPTDVTVDYTSSSSVVEGGQISLNCTSASRPAPTHYKWLIFPNSTTFSPSGSTVVLLDVRRNTSVSCIATNSMGQGGSKQLLLNVHYSPSILSGSVCSTKNGRLTCECQAGANPKPTISWTVDGSSALSPTFNTTTRNNGNLTVSELTGPQGHNVTCTATNSVGKKNSQILVQVEGNASTLAVGAAAVCFTLIVITVIVIWKKRRHAEPSGDPTIALPTKHERRCHDDHKDSDENLYANTQQVQRDNKNK